MIVRTYCELDHKPPFKGQRDITAQRVVIDVERLVRDACVTHTPDMVLAAVAKGFRDHAIIHGSTITAGKRTESYAIWKALVEVFLGKTEEEKAR